MLPQLGQDFRVFPQPLKPYPDTEPETYPVTKPETKAVAHLGSGNTGVGDLRLAAWAPALSQKTRKDRPPASGQGQPETQGPSAAVDFITTTAPQARYLGCLDQAARDE